MLDLSELIIFLLGMLAGAISLLIALAIYAQRQMKNRIQQLIKAVYDAVANTYELPEPQKTLAKVKEITLTQIELKRQLDFPQKNSLHGRHKNGVISEIKSLEEEKVALLKSILASGHDPVVSTLDENGEIKTLKLSEYMADFGFAEKSQESKPKLTILDGGKNGDDSNG